MTDLKAQQHQLRENVILETAHHYMMEQGFADMNMDALASRIGISKATLYQHFSSKEELAVRVILYSMRESEEHFKSLDASLPALERLEIVLRRGIEKRMKLWSLRTPVLPATIREDPRIYEQYRKLAYAVAELVDAAKADGSVRTTLSTPVVVRMYSSFFTILYQDLIHDNIVSPEELGESLVSIFLNGIRSES
ncbi:MAG TPA: TetR/AcrR family transcriptional regulator [Aggregatilineales bacterium]|nr:TetR/AcrR family transcriptional regulator [Aggregatilineales bacterium]